MIGIFITASPCAREYWKATHSCSSRSNPLLVGRFPIASSLGTAWSGEMYSNIRMHHARTESMYVCDVTISLLQECPLISRISSLIFENHFFNLIRKKNLRCSPHFCNANLYRISSNVVNPVLYYQSYVVPGRA